MAGLISFDTTSMFVVVVTTNVVSWDDNVFFTLLETTHSVDVTFVDFFNVFVNDFVAEGDVGDIVITTFYSSMYTHVINTN